MSSIKDEPTLLTFEELKHLEIEDIAICIDQYQALKICEKSKAQGDIYNLWVRKLFKSYGANPKNMTTKDWSHILGYLEKVLDKFIEDLSDTQDNARMEQLTIWWSDTMEFLTWLQSIISNLDANILCLVLAFGFEIVVKTCDKSRMQPVIKIHQHLLKIITNNLLQMDLQSIEELKGMSRVLSSLCDVASILSSSDIKLSIETWRIVTKVSSKCNVQFVNGNAEVMRALKEKSTGKPISGIIKELSKLFYYFLEDKEALANENFLKVAQFYLKLIKILMKNTTKCPTVKEYFELYILFQHKLKEKINTAYVETMQTDLDDILAFASKEEDLNNYLLQHLSQDNNDGVICDTILTYMRILCENYINSSPKINVYKRIFDILFDGPLAFVDVERYPKLLFYFATLTVKDSNSDLHMLWCKNVIESSWIKASVSCEILRIYYGFLHETLNDCGYLCLEFWVKSWHKFNFSHPTSSFCYQRFLIESIIKTITCRTPKNSIDQYIQQFSNSEIIFLKCGYDSTPLQLYFNTNLGDHLKRICDKNINRKQYTELLNLLDICCVNHKRISIFKNDLVNAFLCIITLSPSEIENFDDFVSKCFTIFNNLNDSQVHNTILKCLYDNLPKTHKVFGCSMLEYLQQRKPQSQVILESLPQSIIYKLQKFLQALNNNTNICKTKDFTELQNIYHKNKRLFTQRVFHDVHISKRPRVTGDYSNSCDYKSILSDICEQSQYLLNNMNAKNFDDKDYDMLNCIKNNIEKCLTK
ncbi:uncharacterized protein LOC142238166 [Haematobia irritans]|uniref:uncharacterized protein LOC142238166 n=1 Tax=Haematobia irritans TaxID=7368 RepID=UPI003F5047F6